MSKTIIDFEQVSKKFIIKRDRRNSLHEIVTGIFRPRLANEEFWALRDVSFKVRKGETVGLIGHNGSGKSTTLKLITRILNPTSGSVMIDGRVSALLELGSGFHPDLSGRENIYLNGSLLGFTRAEMSTKIEQIIDFSEMREFIDMPVKHYSSGMYMRLGFAVAIYVNPDILITDEVLAVGDEAFQRKCMERIYSLKKRGTTILFVSHALNQVRDLCDRALWFDHGNLLVDSTPLEAIDGYLADTNIRDAARLRSEAQAPIVIEIAAEAPNPAQSVEAEPGVSDESEPSVEPESSLIPEPQPEAEEATDPMRWGSREVEITEVELIDASGDATQAFYTNEPFTLRIHYLAHEPIDKPVFGVAIYHRSGWQISGPNSRFGGLEIDHIDGAGYVDYHIAGLPLLEGDYELTAAIYDNAMIRPFDHHERKWSMRVYTREVAERYGTLYIPSQWTWSPAQQATLEETA